MHALCSRWEAIDCDFSLLEWREGGPTAPCHCYVIAATAARCMGSGAIPVARASGEEGLRLGRRVWISCVRGASSATTSRNGVQPEERRNLSAETQAGTRATGLPHY